MKYKTICAIITNTNNQILLTKRNREPYRGKWAILSGIGESKKGLTPQLGVAEEVRCDIGTKSFKGTYVFSISIKNDDSTDEAVVFVGGVNEKEISPDPEFSQGTKWVSLKEVGELKDLAFEHSFIIKKYIETLHR